VKEALKLRPVAAGEVLEAEEIAATALVVGVVVDACMEEVTTGATEVAFVVVDAGAVEKVEAFDVDKALYEDEVVEEDEALEVDDCTGAADQTASRH
jgi:hypothetical protein